MLNKRGIQPSSSFNSAPIDLQKKTDCSWRFCVDSRNINDVTVKDVSLMPKKDQSFDALSGAIFSPLSMKQVATGRYWLHQKIGGKRFSSHLMVGCINIKMFFQKAQEHFKGL